MTIFDDLSAEVARIGAPVVAARMGMSWQSMHGLLRRQNPKLVTLVALARACGYRLALTPISDTSDTTEQK